MGKKMESVVLARTEVLSLAKAMWEIQGETAQKIAETMNVSVGTIEKWKVKYEWRKKGVEVAKVEALTRDKFLQELAKQGMPTEKAVSLMIEGMNSPMQDQIIGTDTKGKTKVLYKGNPDYKARHKYHHDYLVLTGLLGNNKTLEVNNNGEGTVNIQVNLPTKKEG